MSSSCNGKRQTFPITKIASAPRCYCFCLRIRITLQEKEYCFCKSTSFFSFKCPTAFPHFRIQAAYLSTGLFGSICLSSLSPISGIHIHICWPLTDVSIWISRWPRENAKKSVRDTENVRNATDEKEAATSHYEFF